MALRSLKAFKLWLCAIITPRNYDLVPKYDQHRTLHTEPLQCVCYRGLNLRRPYLLV